MNLICWNVRGAGNPRTFRALKDVVKLHHPDVLFLSETKSSKRKMESLRVALNFKNAMIIESRGLSGGLCLLWSEDTHITIRSFSRNHVDCNISLNGKTWRFSGIYGCPETHLKKLTCVLLRRLAGFDDYPWLVGGDLNECLWEGEKLGGTTSNFRNMEMLRETVDDLNLCDLGFCGSKFTWTNKSKNCPVILKRLDRFLGNQSFCDLFDSTKVFHLDWYSSDHRPIRICANSNVAQFFKRPAQHFKFEEMWLKDDNCKTIVESAWKERSLDIHMGDRIVHNFKNALKRCSSSLRLWGKKKRHDMFKAVNEQKSLLQQAYLRQPYPIFHDIVGIEEKLNKALEEEEIYWKQRSRENWLKWGDKNTRWFHKKASMRRQKNFIHGIKNTNGVWASNPEHIKDSFVEYFSQIFKSTSVCSQDLNAATHFIPRCVTKEMNNQLLSPFSEEEVRFALFQMFPTKAPGPDGFPALFYQHFWNILKDQTLAFCMNILNNGASVKDINHTNIALIPKIKHPEMPADFRPISLCNVVYKIIAKSLANRLKLVLNALISDSQSAFVPGRLISDNLLVGYECIEHIMRKKKGENGCVALKLDMSKAYDRVEWHFLEAIMHQMGFATRWIDSILDCIRTVSFSVLINGSPNGLFVPQRGLRQGDPLSPYLFILCAESLSSLLTNALLRRSISGCKVARQSPIISHLFFADDSLLFCKASVAECQAIQNILNVYERASGQCVNFSKSAILFSPNVRPDVRLGIKRVLNMKVVQNLGKYLGLPSHFSRNKKSELNFLKERIQKVIAGWKGNFFSIGGKEILIKAVVQAIPTYAMSCIQIPKGLCDELSQIMAKFWWGSNGEDRKIHWKSWETLCLPKEKGGLGFRSLVGFNQSLLAKQSWRMLCFPDSLVARVFKGKYFPNTDILNSKAGYRPSYVWRSIIWGKKLMCKGLRKRIGSGRNTRVFSDPWLPREHSFKPITPIPPLRELTLVSDLISASGRWNEAKLREFFWEDDVNCILSIPLCKSALPDVWMWHFTKDGMFSTRSAYKLFSNGLTMGECSFGNGNLVWWKKLWTSGIPSKVRIFMWKLFFEILPTNLNLCKRNITQIPWCPICKKEKESVFHTFYDCKSSKILWDMVFPQLRSIVRPQLSVKNVLIDMAEALKPNDLELFFVLCWLIWSDRNGVVHGREASTVEFKIGWAKKWLLEIKSTLNRETFSAGIKSSHPTPPSTWVRPVAGRLKLNSDGAVSVGRQKSGGGAVLRDENGALIFASADFVDAPLDVLSIEALGLLNGLKIAEARGFVNFEVELDAINLVNAIHGNSLNFSPQGAIIEEIRKLVVKLKIANIHYAPRSQNKVAHNIANYAINEGGSFFWESNPPNWLNLLLDADVVDCSLLRQISY